MKDRKKMHITFESDNLAVPEVHTNEDDTSDQNDEEVNEGVKYENLAFPEIKIRRPKKESSDNN